MALSGGLIFGIMAALFYRKMRANSELVILNLEGDPQFLSELSQRITAEDQLSAWSLLAAGILLMLLLFSLALLASHRVVGPLVASESLLRCLYDGKRLPCRALRSGDQLRGFFRRIEKLLRALEQKRDKEQSALRGAYERLSARLEALQEAGGELSAQEYTVWLKQELLPLLQERSLEENPTSEDVEGEDAEEHKVQED